MSFWAIDQSQILNEASLMPISKGTGAWRTSPFLTNTYRWVDLIGRSKFLLVTILLVNMLFVVGLCLPAIGAIYMLTHLQAFDISWLFILLLILFLLITTAVSVVAFSCFRGCVRLFNLLLGGVRDGKK